MSSSTEKPVELAQYGPVIAVKLWVPKQVKSTCAPIDTLAEIDTALARTYIQEGVATSLGLEPARTVTITSITAPNFEAHLFRIRIVFPERNLAFEVEAVEVPYLIRPTVRIKCLIGRDILRHSVLVYDGHSNKFSLNFSG